MLAIKDIFHRNSCMAHHSLAHFSPGRTILWSILLTIAIGTLLLALPMARTAFISWPDLIFTATSATCVTGLFTIPLDHFTLFGQMIILFLIQIGGLGLITMTIFIMSLFVELGMATQVMAGQMFELESWKNITQFIVFIIIATIGIECIGACLLLPIFLNNYAYEQATFYAFFHAISSFCSAGIVVFPLSEYSSNYPFLAITTALLWAGTLGFTTLYETAHYLYACFHHRRYRFSLQSKIILYGSAGLLIASAILFWILEHDNVLAGKTFFSTVVTTLFHVVSYKSAGFTLFNPIHLQLATLCLIMLLSFIGSAPWSTGSGVKITTCTIFISLIQTAISGKTSVDIRNRKISLDQVFKAIAIISLSFIWICLTTFCLLITEPGWLFIDLLFESVGAFTNLGITMGVTPLLSYIGKIIIMISMIVGRIGSLSLILALRLRAKKEASEFSYPEERVMLG